MAFFMIFSIFSRKFRCKIFNQTRNSQPYSLVLPEYTKGFQSWRPIMTAQIIFVFVIGRFYDFTFLENVDIKETKLT